MDLWLQGFALTETGNVPNWGKRVLRTGSLMHYRYYVNKHVK
jgi:hypothetical protein